MNINYCQTIDPKLEVIGYEWEEIDDMLWCKLIYADELLDNSEDLVTDNE
jgi:hypothetical protein